MGIAWPHGNMSGSWKPLENGKENGQGKKEGGTEAEFIQPKFPWKIS